MELKFKPKFWRDINREKKDKELMSALDRIFTNVGRAASVNEINNIKSLEKFESRYRIKLFLDKKRDYRIGVYVRRNTVWFARLLPRKKVYEENW